MKPNIFIFEVTLQETEIPVWRIVEVKNNMTLHDLHLVIQLSMGWENRHMYSFSKIVNKNHVIFTHPKFNDPDEPFTGNSSLEYKLRDMFFVPGERLSYIYDFGDSWMHEVVFKGWNYEKSTFGYPACTSGARKCPPEDVGGIPGYMDLLDAINSKNKKRLELYRSWLGKDYDPDDFSADDLIFFNKMLRRFK